MFCVIRLIRLQVLYKLVSCCSICNICMKELMTTSINVYYFQHAKEVQGSFHYYCSYYLSRNPKYNMDSAKRQLIAWNNFKRFGWMEHYHNGSILLPSPPPPYIHTYLNLAQEYNCYTGVLCAKFKWFTCYNSCFRKEDINVKTLC